MNKEQRTMNNRRNYFLSIILFIAHCSLLSALSLAADPPKQEANSDGKSAKAPAGKSLQLDPYAGYARTKIFGLEAQGSKFVYVFDRSGSMGELGGKPLRDAKAELLASLNDLDPRHQFYIVFYNEKPRLFDGSGAKRMVWATDDNKKDAEHFVDGISADGGTDHMAALMVALQMKPDVIFLLTDGEQQDDLTAEDLKRIDHINGGGAQIHVIQFAPTPRRNSTLIDLAKQNRGQHIFVDIKKYGESSSDGKTK
jgi:hypothetical protein